MKRRHSSNAFSSEVDTSSREENATNQKDRAPFRSNRNGKGSDSESDQIPPRKRALNKEEQALWEVVTKSTRPLGKRARNARRAISEAEKTSSPPIKSMTTLKPQRGAALIKRTKCGPPPLVSLCHRERTQLSRGKKEIEARIDLHGMTQARAHRALLNFLQRASEDGLTFVLVIAGKGRTVGSDSERGVLRRQVPEWLGLPEFRSYVVGFEEAHISHGGSGALYVRVRHRRF